MRVCVVHVCVCAHMWADTYTFMPQRQKEKERWGGGNLDKDAIDSDK